MKKKGILLIAVILLAAASPVQAQWEVNHKLRTTLNVTYASRNIWRGYDYYRGDHSMIAYGGDFDFWGTGLGASITGVRAVSSGYENWEQIIYHLYYYNSIWRGQRYQVDYRGGYRYYNHPDGPMRSAGACRCNRDIDFQEAYGRVSFPNACPAGFVPWYELAWISPVESGRQPGCGHAWSYWRNFGGWFHTVGVNRDWTLPAGAWWESTPDGRAVVRTSYEMAYVDGAGPTPHPRRNNADHVWAYGRWGASTDVVVSKAHSLLTFTPGVYYQSSWEDSVNTSDELWVTLGMKYEF